MTHTINGLPSHVLIVHFVVVLVPLVGLLVVVCAAWPVALRRAGVALPGLALVALVAVPLATSAGEWLQERLPRDPLVERHAGMGDGLLPWVIGLFALSVVLWLLRRAADSSGSAPSAIGGAADRVSVRITGVVLALAVAIGAGVQVYRIGDSGAKAVWQGFSSSSGAGDADRSSPAARPGR